MRTHCQRGIPARAESIRHLPHSTRHTPCRTLFPTQPLSQAEMLNGRAAMIGFAALLAIELVKGSPLF